MEQSLYKVSFKDEYGTYEVMVEGNKRLEDAREMLLWKLRGEASNYMHIRDVYYAKSGEKWVKDPPPEIRCRKISDYKSEELEDIDCFIWKNFSLDAPT